MNSSREKGQSIRWVYIVISIIIVISLAVAIVFSRNAAAQNQLFEFMESFFGKQLDREEWMGRFSGSWIFIPVIAEVKVFILIIIGRWLSRFIGSEKGNISNDNRVERLFNSKGLLYTVAALMIILFGLAVYYMFFEYNGGRAKSIKKEKWILQDL